MTNLQTGDFGEDLAVKLLEREGLKVLNTKLRLALGEIDILAEDGDTVVVVEVKTKSDDAFGHPADMVGKPKRRKLRQLAKLISVKYPDRQLRIDVVTCDMSTDPPELEHFADAVDCLRND